MNQNHEPHICKQTVSLKTTERCLEKASKRLDSIEKSQFFFKIVIIILFITIFAFQAFNLNSTVSHLNPIQKSNQSQAESKQNDPRNFQTGEKLLKICLHVSADARQAFISKDYVRALKKAKECCNLFEFIADEEQHILLSQGQPEPAIGKIKEISAEEIEKIQARIILNNTAECFYIKGSSYLALRKPATSLQSREDLSAMLEKAKKAFSSAKELTYARAWNIEDKEIWSPALSSEEKLQSLQNTDKSNTAKNTQQIKEADTDYMDEADSATTDKPSEQESSSDKKPPESKESKHK